MIVCQYERQNYKNPGNGYTVAVYRTRERNKIPAPAIKADKGNWVSFTAVGMELPGLEHVDIELEGTTYTASVWDWFQIMNGSPAMATVTGSNDKVELCFPAGTDPEKNLERAVILAALENAVLQNYNYMPLIGDSAATLLSQKVNYFSDEYMFPMGFGGIPRMTFNYSDQEWADYVASQGGTLNYN